MGARRPLLLTGGSGLVGSALYGGLSDAFKCHCLVHETSLAGGLQRGDRRLPGDLSRPGEGHRLVESVEPEVVVHLAAASSLAFCQSHPQQAWRINVEATRELAQAAAASGAWMLFLSTDQVFDGEQAPYQEADPTAPMSTYGRTKQAAEEAVREACPDALVLRTALVLGPSPDGRQGALDMLRPGHGPVGLFADEWRTPLSVRCLGRLVEALLRQRPAGVLHAAGVDRVSRLELGHQVRDVFGYATRVEERWRASAGHPRPRDLSLALGRLEEWRLPRPLGLHQALRELADEQRQQGGRAS